MAKVLFQGAALLGFLALAHSDDMEETETTVTIAVSVLMAVVLIGMVVVYTCCHYGRRCHCCFRDAQESIDDLGTGGLGIALNAQPFIARPLAVSPGV